MEDEFDEYSQKKSAQIKKMKAIIKQLKFKLEDMSKSDVGMSKYTKLKENYKQVSIENQHLSSTVAKLKEHSEDLNKKKNRLNFLIFLCMKEGYPINKIYQNEIKPIDSHRFNVLTPNKFKNSVKVLNENLRQRRQ